MEDLKERISALESLTDKMIDYLEDLSVNIDTIKNSTSKLVSSVEKVDLRLQNVEVEITRISTILTKIDAKELPIVKGDLNDIKKTLEDIDTATGFKGMVSNLSRSTIQA